MRVAIVRWLKRKWHHPSREIVELAEAAGYTVIMEREFYGNKSHRKQYIPQMVLDDILDAYINEQFSKLIIDGPIRTQQLIYLEKLFECEVIDKAMLILEIFSKKANSKDIRLQVELAQLKYNIPRSVAQVGESLKSERPGFGGTGETITELLISDIKKRVRRMERKLKELKEAYIQNSITKIPKLPIIGYYSSGKSTLFNILTKGNQEVAQEAFTTLLLKTGRTYLTGYPVDLVDTIGIVDLPKDVLNAFDLMLTQIFSFKGVILCLDSSVPLRFWEDMLIEFNHYFERFASNDTKVIVVISKTDLVDNSTIEKIKEMIYNQEWLSNFEILESSTEEQNKLEAQFVHLFEKLYSDELITFEYSNLHPRFASKLHSIARIDSQDWNSDGTTSIIGTGLKMVLAPVIGEIEN